MKDLEIRIDNAVVLIINYFIKYFISGLLSILYLFYWPRGIKFKIVKECILIQLAYLYFKNF